MRSLPARQRSGKNRPPAEARGERTAARRRKRARSRYGPSQLSQEFGIDTMASITSGDVAVTSNPTSGRTFWSRGKLWLRRFGMALAGLLGFYALFLLLGFIPVNRDYRFPPSGRSEERRVGNEWRSTC